jgi:hypothetical protein
MVDDAIRGLDFRPRHDLVVHMILSHHGSPELGSPKLPIPRSDVAAPAR